MEARRVMIDAWNLIPKNVSQPGSIVVHRSAPGSGLVGTATLCGRLWQSFEVAETRRRVSCRVCLRALPGPPRHG